MSSSRRKIGSISVLSKLGHGGMAAVYAGFHHELEQFVAVKTLFSEISQDSKARARFDQEAKIYERLRHPNIVQLLERSAPDDEVQFLALEYVKGTSLRSLLREQGALPPGDALDVMEDLAKALDHAHAQGIIHRDIKPQNIIINQDGILKLLDFGIARLATNTGVGTATGQVLGTYAYAPPEQNQGKEIDQTADLYSLGMMAWEMLVGRRFVTGTSPPEIVMQQMKGAPEPPSSHVPGLPKELDDLILKLCQPYPEDRFRSATEVCQELRSLRRTVAGDRDSEAFFGDEIHEKWILAKNAWNNGQQSLAGSIARFIVSRRDDFAPAHFLLAKLYADRGMHFNASDSFRRVLELAPENEDYMLDFALCLYRMEDLSSAHRELMRLLTVSPENEIALGFEDIVRREIEDRKASEIEVAEDPLDAPLWFDTESKAPAPPEEKGPRYTDDGPTDRSAPPPPPPEGGPGEEVAADRPRPSRPTRRLRRPGAVDRRVAAGKPGGEEDGGRAPPPSPIRFRLASALLPGAGQLLLGRRGAGIRELALLALVAGAFLAIQGFEARGFLQELGRMAGLVLATGALVLRWKASQASLGEALRLEALAGTVVRDLGDGQLRIDVGSDRGAEVGQTFEVRRPPDHPGGPAGPTVAELRIDRVRATTSEGLCRPLEGAPGVPEKGDQVRIAGS